MLKAKSFGTQDLNPQPQGPKPSALPIELFPKIHNNATCGTQPTIFELKAQRIACYAKWHLYGGPRNRTTSSGHEPSMLPLHLPPNLMTSIFNLNLNIVKYINTRLCVQLTSKISNK